MAKRRRRRTSIRTAANTVQDQFIRRMKDLRADPTRVLPECPDGEPKAMARIRKKVEAMAAKGKGGLLDRRDKGIVGAVAHALPLAELTSVPRIADRKILGKRRFFLQRGHVSQACSVGVQNFDDPLVLLTAYRPMAKSDNLHFFADANHLWCSGDTPRPPREWIDTLTKNELHQETEDRWGCGHRQADRVSLRFRGGPAIAICPPCARPEKNLHVRLAARYAGPRQRQPVEVEYLAPDGVAHELRGEVVAAYRAGAATEGTVAAEGRKTWRPTGGTRYVFDGHDFGDDQEAFVQAVAKEEWERAAVRAATPDGHTDIGSSIEDILHAHQDHIVAAWRAATGNEGAPPRIPGRDLRGWLRREHDDAQRTRRMQRLPDPGDLGPVGRYLDRVARVHAADGPAAALRVAREGGGALVPAWQMATVMRALGGDLPRGLDEDSVGAVKESEGRLRELLEARGDAYVELLRRHLHDSGTGEAPGADD